MLSILAFVPFAVLSGLSLFLLIIIILMLISAVI